MISEMGQVMPKTESDELLMTPYWSVLRERVRRMALALTRSVDDADDLAQQTLLTLLVKRPDRTDHTGYARSTMIRLWLDRQRSLRRRLHRVARAALTARRWHTDSDRLSVSDQYDRVQQAIQGLPPRQRVTLVLRLVEGMDYGEIAETLDCSVQTVRANLHLGRQRVRQVLGGLL